MASQKPGFHGGLWTENLELRLFLSSLTATTHSPSQAEILGCIILRFSFNFQGQSGIISANRFFSFLKLILVF